MMPIARITYRLPDEESEYLAAMQGVAALAVLHDIDQHCRSLVKHGTPSPETESLAEHIRQLIAEADVTL